MNIPYYQVHAFTDKLFSGNPAGVCILTNWLPDPLLQSIATENNLSETAFVIPSHTHYDLRWFTPSIEVDLCGHATLAAAHVIFHHLAFNNSQLTFQTRSGALGVTRNDDLLALDFPARPATISPVPRQLAQALGCEPLITARTERDYFAVLPSEAMVRKLRPDIAALTRLDRLGVIVTAPGVDCDFVSRFFAPRAGIPEDPVTGSAHCTLIPYWAERLGKSHLRALQVSPRGGELICEHRGERVSIAGQAVTYSSGQLNV